MCGFCFSGNKTEKSIPVKAQTPSSVQLANLTPGMMYKLWVFPIWSSPSEHSYITFTTSSGERGFSPAAGVRFRGVASITADIIRVVAGGGLTMTAWNNPHPSPPAALPPLPLTKEPPPASPGGCSTSRRGGEPQEGMGIPLKERVLKENVLVLSCGSA